MRPSPISIQLGVIFTAACCDKIGQKPFEIDLRPVGNTNQSPLTKFYEGTSEWRNLSIKRRGHLLRQQHDGYCQSHGRRDKNDGEDQSAEQGNYGSVAQRGGLHQPHGHCPV